MHVNVAAEIATTHVSMLSFVRIDLPESNRIVRDSEVLKLREKTGCNKAKQYVVCAGFAIANVEAIVHIKCCSE
jgi:hypothetical protein